MNYLRIEKILENIPRRINMFQSKFNFNDISYNVKILKFKEHNKLNIYYAELQSNVDKPNRQIIVKMYEELNKSIDEDIYMGLLDEIDAHWKIEKSIGYDSYPSHMLFYFVSLRGIGIIYDYLGCTFENVNLKQYNFKIKKQMILDLLSQVDLLQKNDIYHADLKPQNICIGNNGQLTLIDFGICYFKSYYTNNESLYDTTITCGSPEFASIYLNDISRNTFPKEMFDKSQYFALGGLILGILLDEPNIYFTKSFEILNNLKHPNDNLEVSNLEKRFNYFNLDFCEKIKQFINLKLSEPYSDFKSIILNMFEYDFNSRLSIDLIITQIEKIDL